MKPKVVLTVRLLVKRCNLTVPLNGHFSTLIFTCRSCSYGVAWRHAEHV